MTTAQQVFELAMNLMDEVNESTGAADTSDTKEYKNRTLAILNVIRGECFAASDNHVVLDKGRRPICPIITDFETPIDMDDGICQGVMPYGLAAHLLIDENPDMASFFNQRYQEMLFQMKSNVPAQESAVLGNYTVTGPGCGWPYNDMGAW